MAKILREIKNDKGHVISTQEEDVPSQVMTTTAAAPNPEHARSDVISGEHPDPMSKTPEVSGTTSVRPPEPAPASASKTTTNTTNMNLKETVPSSGTVSTSTKKKGASTRDD